MFSLRNKTDWKYFKIEVLFFVVICYLTGVISDIEYRFHEEHNVWNFTESLEYRLTAGTFLFVFYGAYYWLFLKPFLYKKQLLYVCISVVCFVIADHLYDRYVLNWGMSKLWFLSDELRNTATKNFNSERFFFKMNYFLNRVIFTIIGFAYLIRSLQQDEQLKTLKEQQLLSELTYLKAQLQPHFFFNTLNNIYGLALKRSEDTALMVSKLAEMMRYILYRSTEERLSVKEEIAFIQNYVELEQIRYRNSIDIHLDIQGVSAHRAVAPLLLLPFVENAFKHGIAEEQGTGFVNIVVCQTETELILEIQNSVADKVGRSGGIGLANVKKRLDLLYPSRYELVTKEQDNIYVVSLTLQLHD